VVTYSPREKNELHLVLLDEDPEAYGVPEWVIVHRLDSKASLPGGYFSLRKLIRQIEPDLVLSFLTRANLLAIAVCRPLGIRCVISERVHTTSHHNKKLSGTAARFMIRQFYPKADAI